MAGPPEATSPRTVGPDRRRPLLVVSLTAVLVLVLAYWLRLVVGPLLLALCLAYMLEPTVQRLVRWRLGRPAAVSLVFLVFLVAGGAVLWLLVRGAIDLYRAAFLGPGGEGGFLMHLPDLVRTFYHDQIEKLLHESWRADVGRWLDDVMDPKSLIPVLEKVPAVLSGVGSGLGGFLNLVSFLVLVPIYLFYFMLDYPKVLAWIERHLPGRQRPRLVALAKRIHRGLASFLRGRLLIAVVKGFLLALGLELAGVPFPFTVGLASGLLSIFPFIGAALGLVTAVLLVLAYQAGGIGTLGWVAVAFAAAEAIEGYVLFPWILGDELGMHPITMLFSVLAWGALLGFFGVLVAIPLTIVVRAVVEEYLLPPLEQLAAEAPQQPPEEGR